MAPLNGPAVTRCVTDPERVDGALQHFDHRALHPSHAGAQARRGTKAGAFQRVSGFGDSWGIDA
jgi:hypothetical protein